MSLSNDLKHVSVGRQNRAILEKSECFFLSAAGISFIFSISLWFFGSKDQGVFVGLWVPSIIGLGVFFQNIQARYLGR